MGRLGESKLLVLDARHPGLKQKVDGMFDTFATTRAVESMIRAEYGEHIAHSTICNYRKRFWMVQRDRVRAVIAAMAAYQELVAQGRN